MNAARILAIVLIVGGSLGLVYGGFTYTKDSHEAKLDPIELSVKDRETVNIPVWAGVVPLKHVLDIAQPDGDPKGPPPQIRRFQP